jgi:phospholipid/cholesterol/gamma-HCH transport system ATP-binding protein
MMGQPRTVRPYTMAQDSTESIVELRHLTFGYGERVILRDVSLRIPLGKVTALIGPMGSGKTTTLRLIGGLNRPQAGQVLFEGQDVSGMDQKQLYAVRRRMGMMFQFGALFAPTSACSTTWPSRCANTRTCPKP